MSYLLGFLPFYLLDVFFVLPDPELQNHKKTDFRCELLSCRATGIGKTRASFFLFVILVFFFVLPVLLACPVLRGHSHENGTP